MAEVVLIGTEAYNQLQQQTFKFIRNLVDDDRKKSSIEWLDNNDAATLLKVSKRTLQDWRNDGLIGFSQIGSKIYYSRAEIDRFLMAHFQKPYRAAA